METTITLELIAETQRPLRELEHQLKAIHGLKIFFVEPRDETAPILLSISIPKKDEHADLLIRRISHTIYDFVHSSETGLVQITLVTIEGERVEIMSLESEEIRQIIETAYTGQSK